MKLAGLFTATMLFVGSTVAVNAGAIGLGNGGGFYTNGLENALLGQGHTVSVVNSYTAGSLAGFDVYIQDGNSFYDQAALLTYVQNGGTLIQLPWSLDWNTSYAAPLQLMTGASNISYGQSLPAITVIDAADPLLAGVTIPAAGAFTIGREIGLSFTGGAHQILQYGDGTALLASATVGTGMVIAFNIHMITSDASPLNAPWNDQIIFNAVNLAAGPGTVPEPLTLSLFGAGIAGIAVARRRKNKAAA